MIDAFGLLVSDVVQPDTITKAQAAYAAGDMTTIPFLLTMVLDQNNDAARAVIAGPPLDATDLPIMRVVVQGVTNLEHTMWAWARARNKAGKPNGTMMARRLW